MLVYCGKALTSHCRPDTTTGPLYDAATLLRFTVTGRSMTKVDALEDVLIGNERGSAKDLSNNNTAWQRKRNRERLAEVIRCDD